LHKPPDDTDGANPNKEHFFCIGIGLHLMPIQPTSWESWVRNTRSLSFRFPRLCYTCSK